MNVAKRQGRDRVVTFASGQSDDATAELDRATPPASWGAPVDAVDTGQPSADAPSRDIARIATQMAAELGLDERDIPLHSRVVLVAAAYYAMTGHRSYAPQLDADQAVAELRRFAGGQFDARTVDALARAITGGRGGPQEA